MICRVSCATCSGPYDKPDDDPDPSHPGCAPADASRFGGVRRYVGAMVAGWWSMCGCGTRIGEGDRQFLRDTGAGARWVCSETCPTMSRPESRAAVAAPVPV